MAGRVATSLAMLVVRRRYVRALFPEVRFVLMALRGARRCWRGRGHAGAAHGAGPGRVPELLVSWGSHSAPSGPPTAPCCPSCCATGAGPTRPAALRRRQQHAAGQRRQPRRVAGPRQLARPGPGAGVGAVVWVCGVWVAVLPWDWPERGAGCPEPALPIRVARAGVAGAVGAGVPAPPPSLSRPRERIGVLLITRSLGQADRRKGQRKHQENERDGGDGTNMRRTLVGIAGRRCRPPTPRSLDSRRCAPMPGTGS